MKHRLLDELPIALNHCVPTDNSMWTFGSKRHENDPRIENPHQSIELSNRPRGIQPLNDLRRTGWK